MIAARARSAELIAKKYLEDGPDAVRTYQNLRFDKHVRLLQDRLGLVRGARVLDVGCGTGAMLIELERAGARVIGIDTFEEADGIDREIAKARCAEERAASALVQATASALPFVDGAFDIAVSIGMLEHIPPAPRRKVLEEIYRTLKPGGCLLLIAGPTRVTPFDQHIPGFPFANWLPRELKLKIAEASGRRQFLAVPWGISRRELRRALPTARMQGLYGDYFALNGGQPIGSCDWTPLWLLAWAKRRFKLDRLFGYAASLLYALGLEHCHIVSIRKTA